MADFGITPVFCTYGRTKEADFFQALRGDTASGLKLQMDDSDITARNVR